MANVDFSPGKANPVLLQAARNKPASTAPAPVTASPMEGETVSASSSTRSKVTTITPIDSPKAVTFNSAMDAITAGTAEFTQLSQKAIESTRATGDIAKDTAGIVDSAAKDKQLIESVKSTALLDAQVRSKEVFNAMGGADRLVELATGRKAAVDNMLAKQQEVKDLIDISFLETPLDWIASRFMLEGTQEEEKAAMDRVALYDTAISNITGLASNVDRALENVAVTTSVGTIAAQKALIAKQTAVDAAAYRLKAEQSNAEEVNLLMNASKAQVAAAVDSYKLGLMARSEERAQADRDMRSKALEEDDDDEFRSTYVAGVVAGRKRTGVPVYEGTDPTLVKKQRNEILAEQKLGGDLRERANKQFEVGIGKVAPTPYQTIEAYSLSDPTRFTDGSNPALEALANTVSVVQTNAAQTGVKLTKENIPNLINAQADVAFTQFEKEIKSGDTDNPNHAVPLSAIIGMAGVKDEPFVKNILVPLIVGTDVKDMAPEKVFETALAAIKTRKNPEGTLTFEQAIEGVRSIYAAAIAYNNISQDRAGNGLPIQKAYNAKLKGRVEPTGKLLGFLPAGLGFKKTVDMSDPVALRAAAVRALSPVNSMQDIGLTNMNRRQER